MIKKRESITKFIAEAVNVNPVKLNNFCVSVNTKKFGFLTPDFNSDGFGFTLTKRKYWKLNRH